MRVVECLEGGVGGQGLDQTKLSRNEADARWNNIFNFLVTYCQSVWLESWSIFLSLDLERKVENFEERELYCSFSLVTTYSSWTGKKKAFIYQTKHRYINTIRCAFPPKKFLHDSKDPDKIALDICFIFVSV